MAKCDGMLSVELNLHFSGIHAVVSEDEDGRKFIDEDATEERIVEIVKERLGLHDYTYSKLIDVEWENWEVVELNI